MRLQRGIAAIETLLAAPVLLLLGLGAVQLALVYQARHALNWALLEAARAGSVAHADPVAVRDGLARGLVPWLQGASDLGEYAASLAGAEIHVASSEASGALRLRQVSPDAGSFDDWAEPARGPDGEPVPGVREIPNDGLVHRATRTMPAGGPAGWRGAEPIGSASGQTLADANLLKLRLDYGVPLVVPVVGRAIAWAMRTWHGCAPGPAPARGQGGADAFPTGASPSPWACAMLGATGSAGHARLPVSVAVTVRMQSPAREAGVAASVGADVGGAPAARAPAPRPVGPGDPSAPEIPGGAGEPTGSPSVPPAAEVPGAPSTRTGTTATQTGVLSTQAGAPRPFTGTGAPAPDPAFCRSPDN